ncbi:uncharacterized MFS-type transporter C09D4.1-like isoform X1 [Schistocerca serialis cubense]|uniref:uncharacterized MFS-type transporter C09D4.1-like isoform X1 n=1 Tax=Schistocerca serialis cubense TaxID=2023355 RepID=UPI00214EDFBA|nr:uncharacterized MFS-type transporter C09D4.1-like isoform X1 [Schistocerca serialis cubense]
MSIRADYAAVALQDPAQSPLPLRVRVYPQRWLILAIYMLFSTSNLWQWIQYAIVGNLVRKYYDVSSYAVDWTSVLFMLVYIPFVYPASSLINEKGLRLSILLGAALNAAATWLKVLAVAPGRFWLLLVAQSIAAVAQVFVLTVPPTVAFLWFGANEVSTACALGVFGNQLGVSLSFFLTPLLITDHENVEDIGWDMKVYSYSLAGGSTLVLLLVIAFFQDKPATPPSVAVAVREMSASKQGEAGGGSSLVVLRRLLRCPPFLLLVASLSLCFIVFNAVGTMLNPLILLYFPAHIRCPGRDSPCEYGRFHVHFVSWKSCSRVRRLIVFGVFIGRLLPGGHGVRVGADVPRAREHRDGRDDDRSAGGELGSHSAVRLDAGRRGRPVGQRVPQRAAARRAPRHRLHQGRPAPTPRLSRRQRPRSQGHRRCSQKQFQSRRPSLTGHVAPYRMCPRKASFRLTEYVLSHEDASGEEQCFEEFIHTKELHRLKRELMSIFRDVMAFSVD